MKKFTLTGLLLGTCLVNAQNQKIKPSGVNNFSTQLSKKFLTVRTENNTGKKAIHSVASNPSTLSKSVNNWQAFSSSANIYGLLIDGNKPLQYNNSVGAVSFIQRKSASYTASPADNTGAIVAMISSDWGTNWDSTCIWSDGSNLGRYPQGAIYSAPGNTNIANAYAVGSGIVTDGGSWIGSWYASKQLGAGNYNATASSVTNAMQMLPNSPPYAAAGKHDYSAYSFASTSDGKVRSMAYLCNDINATDIGMRGYKVITGTYNAGVFTWASDSMVPVTEVRAVDNSKHIGYTPVMAWSEDGTVGYAIVLGVKAGATGSNRGYQPIVYKTTNSGSSWATIPSIDFSTPSYSTILNRIEAVANSSVTVPQFNTTEGIDATVDANGKLHIACLIAGTSSSHIDSLDYTYQFTSENYQWSYAPGKRPYLYDFYGDGTGPWSFRTVDSLSSEGPSDISGNPGYAENPWDEDAGQKVRSGSRIQIGRSVDGKNIFYSWAESDTNFTTGQKKWNNIPDIKLRMLDVQTNSLHAQKTIVSKIGNNSNITSKAMFHYMAPTSKTSTMTATGPTFYIPFTVTNSNPYSQLTSNTHYFFGEPITFISVGINEVQDNINSWSVYPNPASSNVTISVDSKNTQSASVTVLDMLGKQMKQFNANFNIGENTIQLNTNDLSKGIYLVTIKAGNSSSTKKLVIE